MKTKICCITGHRNIPQEKTSYVKASLRRELETAVTDGYTEFISGFAEGADLLFAEIVTELKNSIPTIKLTAAIPTRQRLLSLQKNEHVKALLDHCSNISVISEKYHGGVFAIRNRYMVDRSERVIAVYDGRNSGGTITTIRYALRLNKEICEIFIGPDPDMTAQLQKDVN